MSRSTGFDNRIVFAPSGYKEPNATVKWRHMDERRAAERMEELGPTPEESPFIILGHSHEPRDHALSPDGKRYTRYFNTGSAGLYENLIWSVEVVDGQPRSVAWVFDKDHKPLRIEMEGTAEGKLIPKVEPTMME